MYFLGEIFTPKINVGNPMSGGRAVGGVHCAVGERDQGGLPDTSHLHRPRLYVRVFSLLLLHNPTR